jgi:signal transduction histidine kinase/Tfp pilus assembly protein PilF
MVQTTLKNILILCIIFSCTYIASAQNAAISEYSQDTATIHRLDKSAKVKSLKNFDEAIIDINKAVTIAKKYQTLEYKKIQFRVYRRAGIIYEDNLKLNEARDYYQKALSLIDLVSYELQLDIMIDWAIVHKKLNKFIVSRDYFNRALKLAQQVGDIEMEEFSYNGLGTLHEFLGEFDLAAEAYIKSNDLSKKRSNNKSTVVSLANISGVYCKSKNFDLAFDHAKQAYDLALKIDDTTKIGIALNAFGKILNEQGKYDTALIYHQKALALYDEMHFNRYIAYTLISLADVHINAKNYALAKDVLERCLKVKDYLEFYEHPNLYLKLGILNQKTKDYDKAIAMYNESIVVAKQRGIKDIVQKSSFNLSEVYRQKEDYKTAFDCLHTANIYGDSIFSEEKARRLAEAQYKFDVEKAAAQYTTQYQEQKQKQQSYMLAIVLLFTFIVIVALGYYLKMRTRSNMILLQKNNEIQFQNERLEKSNEILRQFAYASAHDLKEPLRSISSFVHIIERRYAKLLPPEAGEYMNFVTSGVKRMENLLSALLEYSTVASEDQEITRATSLSQVLVDVQDNLRVVITEKDADIDIKGVLPSLYISKLHLTQLFQNLMSNSLKFTNTKPSITIQGSVSQAENTYTLKFTDNGIGMKQEYSDKIFRLFQRLSRNAQYEGTGIGLAICKHIVDKYNGKIWFESKENEGTNFFISFPIDVIKMEKNTEGVLELV